MKKGGMITIVTLSYNNCEKLIETIDSVLLQNYENIEYIISDDGGNDFHEEYIKEYINLKKKDNIKKILVRKNKENIGTVAHNNLICDIASGEYIIQVSCGDKLYDANTVANIVKKIVSSNPELLVCRRLVCDNDGNPLYYLPHIRKIKKLVKMSQKEQYESLVSGYFWDMASGSATVYNTEYVRKKRFDEKYKLLEDYPFFTKYTYNKLLISAYDVISVKYYLGGVSNTKNPFIITDMCTYNSNERIKHMTEISFFSREKANYQIARAKNKNIIYIMLRFPHILLWIFLYKIDELLGKSQDNRIIRKNQKNNKR